MGTATTEPTQVRHPWRATVRTVLWAGVGLATVLPLAYSAATSHEPGEATGWVGLALMLAGAVTRVMALPVVNDFLTRWLPWLAAQPGERRDS